MPRPLAASLTLPGMGCASTLPRAVALLVALLVGCAPEAAPPPVPPLTVTTGTFESAAHPQVATAMARVQRTEDGRIRLLADLPADVAEELARRDDPAAPIDGATINDSAVTLRLAPRAETPDAETPDAETPDAPGRVALVAEDFTTEATVVRLQLPRAEPIEAVKLPRELLRPVGSGWAVCLAVPDGDASGDNATHTVTLAPITLLKIEGRDALVRLPDDLAGPLITAGFHRIVPGQTVRVAPAREPAGNEASP